MVNKKSKKIVMLCSLVDRRRWPLPVWIRKQQGLPV